MPVVHQDRPDRNPRRMRILWVLSSANQMYSGIGRALFELTQRLGDRADYELAIDDAYPRNLKIVRAFADRWKLPLHVSRGLYRPRCMDTVGEGIGDLVAEPRWDLVECLSWANAATNEVVLDAIGDRALGYTPHYQPLWTVPMNPETSSHVDDVMGWTLDRSDVIFCDSPWERQAVLRYAPTRENRVHLSLGCDFRQYQVGRRDRSRQLLFVGDLAEPRKRLDRVLGVMDRLVRRFPDVKLVVVGNGSDGAIERIPEHLRPNCELKGYVDEAELRRAYAESSGLFLLSDFEAFGIPILEALAVGTPVFLTDLDVTRSIFNLYRGARFCPGDDIDATAGIVERSLERGAEAIDEALADRARLEAAFDWDVLAEQKWQALRSAWFGRHYVGRPFHGPHATFRAFPRPEPAGV